MLCLPGWYLHLMLFSPEWFLKSKILYEGHMKTSGLIMAEQYNPHCTLLCTLALCLQEHTWVWNMSEIWYKFYALNSNAVVVKPPKHQMFCTERLWHILILQYPSVLAHNDEWNSFTASLLSEKLFIIFRQPQAQRKPGTECDSQLT